MAWYLYEEPSSWKGAVMGSQEEAAEFASGCIEYDRFHNSAIQTVLAQDARARSPFSEVSESHSDNFLLQGSTR